MNKSFIQTADSIRNEVNDSLSENPIQSLVLSIHLETNHFAWRRTTVLLRELR